MTSAILSGGVARRQLFPAEAGGAQGARRDLSRHGAWALAVLIVAVPLLRGAASAGLEAALALGVLAAGSLAGPPRGSYSRVQLVLGGLVAWMSLQLLPLPAWLHGLSWSAREIFQQSLGPLGLYPAARPLSLDPAATGRALLLAASMTVAYGAGWAIGKTRSRRLVLVQAIGLGGLLAALTSLGAALLGASPVLAPTVPFVNPNHLAGYLALSAFVLLALALRDRGQARLLWLLAFSTVGVMVFLSLSRGGIAAFLGGGIVFGWLSLGRGSAAPLSSTRRTLLVGLAAVIIASTYLALDPLLAEMGSLSRPGGGSKLALWRPGLQMLGDYPLIGVGRGAFGAVFPAYKTEPDPVTFTHLENEWLQPLLELGLPGGVLLVGALAAAWVAALRRRDGSVLDAGLLSGIAALALQNLVDFSLELAGVALPFMVALGLAARGSGGSSVRPAVHRAGLVAAAAVALSGAVAWWARPPQDAPIRSQIAWSPADYLLPAIEGARLVAEDRCAEAMPWLHRAMLLGPTAAEPHLHAARCLAASGQHEFARREYRLAYAFGAPGALQEAAARYSQEADLLELVPDTPEALMRLGDLLLRQRPGLAASAYRKALNEHLDSRALLPLVRALLAAGSMSEALALTERATSETPASAEAWRLRVFSLRQLGRVEESRAVLAEGLRRLPGSAPLVALQVEGSLGERRWAEARQLAERIVPRGIDDLVLRHQLVARALAGQGRLVEAVEQVRSAAALLPSSEGLQLLVAGYCEQAGRFDEAIAAVERAATLSGRPGAHRDLLSRLTEARQRQQERRRSGAGRVE